MATFLDFFNLRRKLSVLAQVYLYTKLNISLRNFSTFQGTPKSLDFFKLNFLFVIY